MLWFFYVAVTVIWFMFWNKDKKEYLQLIFTLGIGMTIFLLVSWVYPNGHLLRPTSFPRENICTDLVRMLYSIDTPTNILPSIHVYNSIAVFIAIARCKALKKKRFIVGSAGVLTVLIIAATMFIKQHTVVDVVLAMALYVVTYLFVYRPEDSRVLVQQRNKREYSGVRNS
jgi:membrane-associated phospholipid phosphatase